MTGPTFTLHLGDCLDVLRGLPDNSIDAVVTDPPYGLGKEPDALAMLTDWITTGHHDVKGAGFMGKAWDAFVPQPRLWAEVFRVLKPGGHVVAFAGTRTQDLMALGLRIAGFEIRDLLAWVYGSGFPKSHDVSKAIDKLDAVEARRNRALQFTGWLRSTGVTSAQIDAVTGSFMGGHYLTASSQPQVATREHFEAMRPLLQCDVPDWVEAMIDQRTVESENFKRREVIETREDARTDAAAWTANIASGMFAAGSKEYAVTAAHTAEAAAWQGWGTALKPALEPITLARKPLDGTVAQTVLRWGTGAVNVDGCRIHADDAQGGEYTVKRFKPGATLQATGGTWKRDGDDAEEYRGTMQPGRWPANLLHDGSDEVVGLFPVTKTGNPTEGSKPTTGEVYGAFSARSTVGHGDSGSAARFFYCAKASKSDRDEGLQHLEARRKAAAEFRPNHAAKAEQGEGGNPYGRWDAARNIHPTVKPTDLMRWLCRLITPPGGVILDPFMGSGSTGKAAQREGFDFVGIEMDPAYMEIARARIATALNPEAPDDPEPAADNDNTPADLFRWGGVAT